MQELIRFLNQGWIGTLVGTVGLAVALLLYWRSRISGVIAFQSHNVAMIGGGDAVFPAEVTVQYQGTPVPGITSSTVWIWNAGKKTVKGTDIVAHDPLLLRFGGEILNVRIRKTTREVIRITADTSGEIGKTVVRCGFEFLDPGDGGVLEVLHAGSAEAPEFTGTIIGLPKGLKYGGLGWGTSTSSRWQVRFNRFLFAVPFIVGLGIIAVGILGEQYVKEALPFFAEPPERQPPSWLLVLLGLLMSLCSAVPVWRIRRQSPSSLDVN